MDIQTDKARDEVPAQRAGRFSRTAGCFFVVVVLLATALGLSLLRRDQPELVITIEMAAISFGPDEPVPVVAHMFNRDSETVRISPAVEDMTLEMVVVDETGHRYEKTVPYHRGMKPGAPPRDFEPGDEISVTENLADGYNLVPGLRYTVQAAYRTLNYPEEDVWFGIVKSTPKPFSIREE